MDELPELHSDLAPLAFLVGAWAGEGVGGYPTIEDFPYRQQVVFTHTGQPFLSYASHTWAVDDGRPLATETGFWRPRPEGRVEVLITHPTGISEIYVGQVTARKVELSTDAIARTESAKEVTAGHRLYGIIETGELGYAYEMAAFGYGLRSHLSAVLRRVED